MNSPEKMPVAGASEPIPVQSEAGAILHMIERVARDPSVDMDKLERLFAMRDAFEKREAALAFNNAMSAAQAEMDTISNDAVNPQTRSGYASLAAVLKAIRPIYTKHGLSVTFNEEPSSEPDKMCVVAFVSHGAETRRYVRNIPITSQGIRGQTMMTPTHANASAVSYGRRYLLNMIFNLASDDDRDGNADDPINEEQLQKLIKRKDEVEADTAQFCKYMGVESLAYLPAKDFERAMAALNKKGQQKK